jgi:hypothetical protein
MLTNGGPLLRDKQFLLAHDSATGYVGAGATSASGVPMTAAFIKTQSRDFQGQLNCGARALDLRLGFERAGEPLKFQHDRFYMDQTVESTMPSVLNWAKEHPTELVILLLSHCQHGSGSTACNGDFSKPFLDLGINVISDAPKLAGMTLAEAETLATQQNGGRVLAVFADDQFVDSTFPAAQNVITEGVSFGWNWNALWGYADSELGRSHDRPWQLQLIWQETAAVIASYGGVGYSIEKQTINSHINTQIAEKAEAGYLKNANFVLANFVDQEGQRISQAFGSPSRDTC